MKRHVMSKVCGIAATWLLGQGIAHASAVLLDQAGFIQGQESYSQSFDITSPGTLTVTLTNIPWLDTISGLSGFLSNSGGVMGGLFTDGGETMQVKPGMVYAHWFGDASGPYGAGVYGIKVTFQPAGAAVPLPGTIVLLLSGLALFWAYAPKRRATASTTDPQLTVKPAPGVGVPST